MAKLATHLIPEREGLARKAFLATALIPALRATALLQLLRHDDGGGPLAGDGGSGSPLDLHGAGCGRASAWSQPPSSSGLRFRSSGVMLALVVVQGRAVARPVLGAEPDDRLRSVFIMAGAEGFSSMGSATSSQPRRRCGYGRGAGPVADGGTEK